MSDDDEYALKGICEHGHLELLQWFLEINPNCDIFIDDNYSLWEAFGN